MPSAQECAERLREQAYRTLLPQIRELEQELQSLSTSFSAGVHQIERKLEALSHIELPATELVLGEILDEAIRRKDAESSALASFAQDVRKKETQEEILGFLLDSAHTYSPRLALFAVRGEQFVGWSSRGYSETQAREVSSCSFPRSESPLLQRAIEGESPVIVQGAPDERDCPIFLRKDFQGPWQLFPLRAMQRPVAVLLAEAGDAPAQTGALSILANVTAQRLENIALKILYELRAAKAQTPAEAVRTEAQAVQECVSEPAQAAPTPETVEPILAVADSVTGERPLAMQASAAPPLETQDTVVPPPPPSEDLKALEARQMADEEKLHTEAKRFARLLVSEIKLYNEHHVVEGRENRDLYLRLKRDIDRSREMYEKRVSAQVSRKIDYFHDEIIRILGDNDPTTLGSDYPGPRVES
jgi:hypothetical protein